MIFKVSKNIKRITKNVSKCIFSLYFPMQQKLLISCEKMFMSAEIKG